MGSNNNFSGKSKIIKNHLFAGVRISFEDFEVNLI